jgi:hypothetical protein
MTMSKTAAIRATKNSISVWGAGTSWTISGPYDTLGGPSTERSAPSYASARLKATEWRATLLLDLMGMSTPDVRAAVYFAAYDQEVRDLSSLIEVGLKEHARMLDAD